MNKSIFFLCCCLVFAISSTSNALTFKKGESIDFSKRDGATSSSECDPDKGESYLFDDPEGECVNPEYTDWKVVHKNSRKKNEKAFPAYYQLKKQAKALTFPRQYHLYEWHKAYLADPIFTYLPACRDRMGSGRNFNPDMLPAFPRKIWRLADHQPDAVTAKPGDAELNHLAVGKHIHSIASQKRVAGTAM